MSMAKKMISRLSVLAVLIVFLAACSKQTEYTNVIPADATAVASIDLKSLANKAGMNDKENEAAKQKLLEAMKSGMNAATFQQLEKVINNPGASGLDPEAPIYIFSSPQISGGAFVAKVSNDVEDFDAGLLHGGLQAGFHSHDHFAVVLGGEASAFEDGLLDVGGLLLRTIRRYLPVRRPRFGDELTNEEQP